MSRSPRLPRLAGLAHVRLMSWVIMLGVLTSLVFAWGVVGVQAHADDGGGLLWLVRRPEALKAMALDPAVAGNLRTFTDEQDPSLFVARLLPPDQQAAAHKAATDELVTFLEQHATPADRQAIERVRLWTLGLNVFRDPVVRDKLALTSKQKAAADSRLAELEKRMAELVSGSKAKPTEAAPTEATPSGSTRRATQGPRVVEGLADPAGDLKSAAGRLQQVAQRELVEILTPAQRAKLAEQLGPRVDVTGWGGPRLMAPPLAPKGEWLTDRPVDLPAERGRVVILHFFASECINCQRNFPHYKAWQDRFSPKDVTIVGIQSPEVAAERRPERVTARLREAELSHAVAMDLDLSVWKAWGQSMWPTVYVLDRQGRVVTFWMGELDWQGAKGQDTLTDLVEQLLKE